MPPICVYQCKYIYQRFEKTWLLPNMNLEKGSSLLIPEISRPIENDKKKIIWGRGGDGGCADPKFTNHGKWGKCYFRKWKWPFPHSQFWDFRKSKTTLIDQSYPQLVGKMFSETNFLWRVSKNMRFHYGSLHFPVTCVTNATFPAKVLVISNNIC